MVEKMAGYGIPEVDIANVLDIDPKTLRKHYRRELDTAFVHANAKVAGTLFNMATEQNNVAAAIFWMKARAGWREKLQVESTNETIVRTVADTPADPEKENEKWLEQFGNGN
jgi:hypothetical protein